MGERGFERLELLSDDLCAEAYNHLFSSKDNESLSSEPIAAATLVCSSILDELSSLVKVCSL